MERGESRPDVSGLIWMELDKTGLNQSGLNRARLSGSTWTEPEWTRFDQVELDSTQSIWTKPDQSGLHQLNQMDPV